MKGKGSKAKRREEKRGFRLRMCARRSEGSAGNADIAIGSKAATEQQTQQSGARALSGRGMRSLERSEGASKRGGKDDDLGEVSVRVWAVTTFVGYGYHHERDYQNKASKAEQNKAARECPQRASSSETAQGQNETVGLSS